MQQFWRDGLFDDLDARYFRLINRAPRLRERDRLGRARRLLAVRDVREIFRAGNVRKESYFDSMTHFDFKTLLPALLHVEDRVSMAHGLESRVPFVDTEVVEFAATLPAEREVQGGASEARVQGRLRRRASAGDRRAAATRWASRFRSASGRRTS